MILTRNFFPTTIFREECIGGSWGVIYLGKAKAVCLIQTLLIHRSTTYDIHILIGSAMGKSLIKRRIDITSGEFRYRT